MKFRVMLGETYVCSVGFGGVCVPKGSSIKLMSSFLVESLIAYFIIRRYTECPRRNVIVSVILSKIVYIYMCPIPNGFRDRAVSLYTVQASNTPCPHTSRKVH
jgi:hypothetical protein